MPVLIPLVGIPVEEWRNAGGSREWMSSRKIFLGAFEKGWGFPLVWQESLRHFVKVISISAVVSFFVQNLRRFKLHLADLYNHANSHVNAEFKVCVVRCMTEVPENGMIASRNQGCPFPGWTGSRIRQGITELC